MRLNWFFRVLKEETKTLPEIGKPAPAPTEKENWLNIQKGESLRFLHKDFLVEIAQPSSTLPSLIEKISAKKRKKSAMRKYDSMLTRRIVGRMLADDHGGAIKVAMDPHCLAYMESLSEALKKDTAVSGLRSASVAVVK